MKKLKTIGTVREKERANTTKVGLACDGEKIANDKNINIIKNRDRILCKTAKKRAVCVT